MRASLRERGTVLLMVVGVLALLAIIGVVYATLGRADRAMSAVSVRSQRVSDQVEDVAGYLASVVGDGIHARYTEPSTAGAIIRERGITAPWTDSRFCSVDPQLVPAPGLPAGTTSDEYAKFSPTGDCLVAWPTSGPAAGITDPRDYADPYLAVLEPEYLADTGAAVTPLRFRRDWRHISNFAPSGNFINLANFYKEYVPASGVSQTVADPGLGGFNAPPGFDEPGMMSYGLTLFLANGRSASIGNSTIAGPAVRPANKYVPADWCTNQAFAFRPAVRESPTLADYAFNDHRNPLNQWCDADGDGFLDSRWFELVDVSGLYSTPSSTTRVVPAKGRVRLVIAARCIDNSGQINVNTGGDFFAAPGPRYPLTPEFSRDDVSPPGITPGEIDLRRVLAMADLGRTTMPALISGLYAGLPQPIDTGAQDPQNFTNYTGTIASNVGLTAYRSLYQHRWSGSSAPGQTIARESVAGVPVFPPDARTRRNDYDLFAFESRSGVASPDYVNAANQRGLMAPFDMSDHLELFSFFGVNDSDTLSRLEASMAGRLAGSGAYSPLRDRRSRSLEMRSRDEVTALTLFASDSQVPSEAYQDRDRILTSVFTDVRHLLTTVSGARPIKDSGVAPNNLGTTEGRTDVSDALRTIRQWAQLPGPKPAVNSPEWRDWASALNLIFTLYANAIAPYTFRDTYQGVWEGTTPNPGLEAYRLGLVYGGDAELALMTAAFMTVNLADAFDIDRVLVNGRPSDTDDDDGTPTRAYLQLSPSNTRFMNPNERTFHESGVPLALPPERRPRNLTDLGSRRAYPEYNGWMTMYGFEAQPFLAGVSSFFIYTDAPGGSGGDDDEGDLSGPTPIPDGFAAGPPPPEPEQMVTIKPAPSLNNADFIGELIAFQFHNPFDQDIVLYDRSKPLGTTYPHLARNVFYVEYAGRYYSFGKANETNIGYDDTAPSTAYVMRPGETRVFYALNPRSLKELGERIKNVNDGLRVSDRIPNLNIDADCVRVANDWIKSQLKSAGNTGARDPQQMTQVFPTTFDAVEGDVVGFRSYTHHEMKIWGDGEHFGNSPSEHLPEIEQTGQAERRVVHLWRRVQSAGYLNVGGVSDASSTVENNTSNDQLVDRMRDPSLNESQLYKYRGDLGAGNREIAGTLGGDEGSETASEIGDNTGYTMVLWASIDRPTDSAAPTFGAPFGAPGGTQYTDRAGVRQQYRGVLPPWCMENRADDESAWRSDTLGRNSFSLNKTDRIAVTNEGVRGNYGGSDRARTQTLRKMIDPAIASSTPINTQIATACPRKNRNPIADINNNNDEKYSTVAIEYHFVGEDKLGGPVNTAGAGMPPAYQDRKRSRNAALFSRSGDFLLPLAIGSWFAPSRTNVGASFELDFEQWTSSVLVPVNNKVLDREVQWMTMAEAISMACGYYSTSLPQDPLYRYGSNGKNGDNPNDFQGGRKRQPKSDRGHLALDRFSPYFQPPGAGVAQPLGSGVPFALGVIDQFRAALGISSTPDLNAPLGSEYPISQTRHTAYGSTRYESVGEMPKFQTDADLTLVPGTVNLNTMVATTGWAIPMLTPPPPENGSSTEEDENPWVYGNVSTNRGVATPIWTVGQPYDVVAGMLAYRDRKAVAAVNATGATADLRPGIKRAEVTRIPNIREGRFFKSIGEAAAVNFYTPSTTEPPDPDAMNPAFSMFRFSKQESPGAVMRLSDWPQVASSAFYNHGANGMLATTSGTPPVGEQYTVTPGTVQKTGGTQLPNGYQDKLAIINALTNTVSVRSDIFTIYFVIQGYTPDALDVEPTQPLVPTIAKRYVMVVDRSNVVNRGDKPRILMLKEVPMQ